MAKKRSRKISQPAQTVEDTASSGSIPSFQQERSLPAYQRKVLDLRGRLAGIQRAREVWARHLTDDERDRLVSLDEAYANGGTVGVWAQAKRISWQQATVELARLYGLKIADYHWLMHELGVELQKQSSRPSWDKERGELRLNDQVIRRITRVNQAHNIVRILDAFEEEQWPPRIFDPLPGKPDRGRLQDAVRRLNNGLVRIRFQRDGTGEGVTWHPEGANP